MAVGGIVVGICPTEKNEYKNSPQNRKKTKDSADAAADV